MSQQELELPQGWIKTTIENIGQIVTGNTPSKKDSSNYGNFLPWVKPPQLDSQTPIENTPEKLSKKGASVARVLEKNSILISCIGDLGKLGIAGTQLSTNQQINSVTCFDEIHYKFAYYFFQSSIFSLWLEANNSATIIKIINKGRLSKAPFLLPPLNEQKRIVSKIEELFSKIDSTKQSLEHTKLQLEQYRASLLKSAFEGKLTEKWRKQNNPSLDMLFEKIQLNRKSQESKLQKLEPFNDDKPFSIPENWSWTRVGIISNQIQYGTSEKASTEESQLPVLRMGNIQDGVLNFKKLKYYPDNWKSREQYILKDGDVLFNRTNSAELVGKSAIYRNFHPPAVFAGYLIRVKILDEIYFPYLLTWYLNSIFGKSYVKSVVTQQVGQANVNGTKLAMMPIPLMSNEEQEQIISQIEQGFSLIENTSQIVESTLQKLQTMKMSVLKQAFEGKLVPQDPDDEPASELLERIKSTKESQSTKQRGMKNVK